MQTAPYARLNFCDTIFFSRRFWNRRIIYRRSTRSAQLPMREMLSSTLAQRRVDAEPTNCRRIGQEVSESTTTSVGRRTDDGNASRHVLRNKCPDPPTGSARRETMEGSRPSLRGRRAPDRSAPVFSRRSADVRSSPPGCAGAGAAISRKRLVVQDDEGRHRLRPRFGKTPRTSGARAMVRPGERGTTAPTRERALPGRRGQRGPGWPHRDPLLAGQHGAARVGQASAP